MAIYRHYLSWNNIFLCFYAIYKPNLNDSHHTKGEPWKFSFKGCTNQHIIKQVKKTTLPFDIHFDKSQLNFVAGTFHQRTKLLSK